MGEEGIRLSVIVPATDDPPTLESALGPIRRQLMAEDELIVVVESAGPGPADARNRGVGRAGGDVFVFIDADVVAHDDAIGRIRAAFEADPGLGAIFGCYDDAPGDPGLVSQFRNLLHHSVHLESRGPAQTFWAGLGAIRREAFESVDGYDPGRFPAASVEDIDLGMRLHRAGVAIRLDPAIQGKHLKRWTVRSMLSTDLHKRGIPWVALLVSSRSEHPPGGEQVALNLAWRHRLTVLAALVLTASLLRRRRASAAVAAISLAALEHRLYALLYRRGGPRLLGAGLVLHILHLLVAAASVPPGILKGLRMRSGPDAEVTLPDAE